MLLFRFKTIPKKHTKTQQLSCILFYTTTEMMLVELVLIHFDYK
jgi:hypothetical protein